MFTKKSQADIKKSISKIQDAKKDSVSRLRHLKTILEHVDLEEAKSLFETNYSHVYYILYDTFVQAEQNLKQRVHKAHKEELEGCLWLLGKVLCLLPELVAKRWQSHSLSRIMSKLLHTGNSHKLRREGVRYFMLWYQTLGRNAPQNVHNMFSELVPGLSIPQNQRALHLDTIDYSGGDFADHPNMKVEAGTAVFHDAGAHPVKSPDITALLPPSSHEKSTPPDPKDGIEMLLECMVQSCGCIKWRDNSPHRHMNNFAFLLNRFREVYLPSFCPDFDYFTSVYEPKLELPVMRSVSRREELLSSCVVVLVNWVAKYTYDKAALGRLDSFHLEDAGSGPGSDLMGENSSLLWNLRHMGYSQAQLVRDVLYSTRDMINFVHEVYRQAFLLGFTSKAQIDAMKMSISVYRDWMSNAKPPFLLEPTPMMGEETVTAMTTPPRKLRTDSYIGAISKENLVIRAGLQNVLQVFVTNASNVFMVQTHHLNLMFASKESGKTSTPLDEQTDICKRVLNIYRTMVMNTRMEPQTWEQLLLVLLQITKLLLQPSSAQSGTSSAVNSKRSNLGGRLAQPIFQTLIVTWIRAHTNVPVNIILWEKFLTVLASLTHREELIVEWDKTMQTLTRVLARQVYNLNLQDLPLDRLAETKGKRRRGVSVWQGGSGDRGDQGGGGGGEREGGGSSLVSTSSGKGSVSGGVGAGGDGKVCEEIKASNQLRRHLVPGTPGLNRSYSEGSLAPPSVGHNHRRSQCRKTGRLKNHPISLLAAEENGKRSSHQQLANVSLSTSTDNLNISRISTGSQSNHPHPILGRSAKMRRAISLDSVRPQQSSESGRGSRSPSPTASSGMEGGSIKDSPLQIDALAGDSSSIDTQDEGSVNGSLSNDRRSILAGGGARGWLPDVAAIMWKRMLGCLGDVNQIQSPKLHAQVFKYLVEITNNLIKIRMNQGVSLDSQQPPPVTALVPPIGIVAPWCYGALVLDNQYREGKLWALQLLCSIAKHSNNLGHDQLPLFYQALHLALTSEDRAMAYTVLKHLGGPKFLSLLIPGHSLLLLDLVHVATVVVSSTDTTPNTPRFEVAGLLGSLLCCPTSAIPPSVLHPSGPHIELFDCPDLQDHVLNVVMRCARREPTARARCIAISSLSQWICVNLRKVTAGKNVNQNVTVPSRKVKAIKGGNEAAVTSETRIREAFQIILQALQFKHRTIARVAAESLKLCAEKGKYIARVDRLPQMIINSICIALEVQNVRTPKEADKIVLNALILCLGEFCMNIPVAILRQPVTSEGNSPTLILTVLKVLHQLGTTGTQSDRIKLFTADEDFEMTINVDDIREQIQSDPGYQTAETTQNCLAAIRLCARTVAMHLVTNVGHFPMGVGASRLSSLVEEHDDSTFVSVNAGQQPLQQGTTARMDSIDLGIPHLLNSPNMQMFILNPSLVASFMELSALKLPGGGCTAGLVTAQKQVRILLRDINGKSCWDASILYREPKINLSQSQQPQSPLSTHQKQLQNSAIPYHVRMMQNRSLMVGASLDPLTSHVAYPMPPLRHTLRHRPANQLPTAKDIAPDLDQLDDLLQYIGHTSPEVLEGGVPLNFTGHSPMGGNLEGQVISTILNQKGLEAEYLSRQSYQLSSGVGSSVASDSVSRMGSQSGASVSHYFGGGATTAMSNYEFDNCSLTEESSPASTSLENYRRYAELQPFHLCRLLFSQLGLAASQEKRKKTHLLARTEKLLRELRNLDTQRCRETHKMAVIYVGAGQEDKMTILRNTCGSSTYEMFVSALGWEVELETHNGFLGGLPRTGCGSTAPYYATPFLEVIFHVATRMPSDTAEAILTKTRHLGNDEVHIVWSEHGRDYRRDILPTEFCDVLITVYPLRSGLFRVTTNRKPEVPWFGPIWDECVVGGSCLASFVRATAINASRAKRASLPFYQQFYEERNRSLDIVASRHKESTTFEEFASRVYAPMSRDLGIIGSNIGGITSGSNSSSVVGHGGSSATSSTQLAAALLDHQKSIKTRERELTQHTITLSSGGSSGGSTVTDHSPRPGRKLHHPFKSGSTSSMGLGTGGVKKSSSVGAANTHMMMMGSPPESPTLQGQQMSRR